MLSETPMTYSNFVRCFGEYVTQVLLSMQISQTNAMYFRKSTDLKLKNFGNKQKPKP